MCDRDSQWEVPMWLENYWVRIFRKLIKKNRSDLSQMLEMEISEAEQLLVMTRSRTLIWERGEGRLLQQRQVKVAI